MHRPGDENAVFEIHVVVHAMDDAVLTVRVAIVASLVARCVRRDGGPVLAGLGALTVALQRKGLRVGIAPVVTKFGALSWNRGVGAPCFGALAQ